MGGEWLAMTTSLVAAISVGVGAHISLRSQTSPVSPQRFIQWMALGTGVLFIAVLLDFLPDAWESAGAGAPWGIMAGVLAVWGATQTSDRWFQKSTSAERSEQFQTSSWKTRPSCSFPWPVPMF